MTRAAVFDLDGTLLPDTSVERLLVPALVRAGLVRPGRLLASLRWALTHPWVGVTAAVRANKRHLRGAGFGDVARFVERFVDREVMPRLCPALVARLGMLAGRGYRTVLLTGAPDFIARPVAARLGMCVAIATRLEVVGGRFTGALSGAHYFGEAKSVAVRTLARHRDIDLAASLGFADHGADVAFLECFGHPVAVRPRRRLRRVAERRGWEVLGR